MNTLWVATDLTSTMRQSSATTAEVSTGLPVESVVQSPTVKRSCAVSAVRPANAVAIVSSSARKVLTQNTPLAWDGPVERLRRRAGGRVRGGGGNPALAARAVGRHPVDGSAESAHGLAEGRGIDAAGGRRGSHRLEGAGGRVRTG